MYNPKRSKLFFVVLLLLSISVNAQNKNSMPRNTPEAEGVSSKAILSFVEAVEKSKHEFHSFMILRHGKVISEGWWKPYSHELKNTLYSTSKSFTSTAVGFAISEKRLSVDDKVITFFPNDLPDTVSPYLAELKVKDLLSMSVGHSQDPTFVRMSNDTNWVKAFLATPIKYKPGTKFLYNSLATYMLSAIVQKVTGEKIVDYLKPRLFDPLGIKGMDWEVSPMGINTGGWGLRVKTEDMAKFGQLYLQKGNWRGKQIIPKEWVNEATTAKIMQEPDAPQSKKDSSDWLQGYCYQFWRCRNNAFRADGAYGQFIIVMPDQDAVIAITAETTDMQDEINLVWKYLFPAMQAGKLPADKNSYTALRQKLSSLALPMPAMSQNKEMNDFLSGKTAVIDSNPGGIEAISFLFENEDCRITLKTSKGLYDLPFGPCRWKYSETERLGPSLVANAKAHFAGLPPSKIAGSYCWKDANTLEFTLRYIESPHTETMTCRFEKDKVSFEVRHSNDPKIKIPLTGKIKDNI